MSNLLVSQNVTRTGNQLTESLIWGTRWATNTGAAPIVPVSFYAPTVTGSLSYRPLPHEIDALRRVTETYARYINLDLVFDATGASNFHGITFAASRTSLAGQLGSTGIIESYSPSADAYSFVRIYRDNAYNTAGLLQSGSRDYLTYLHEFGHALGLAHPHDTGGAAGNPSPIFPGVTSVNSLGSFSLNQGVYTIMGYNDGWTTGPLGPSPSSQYGYAETPMALDVLALQQLYGANQNTARGNDTYKLPDQNISGTGYDLIWDAAGIDTIQGAAQLSNMIDLRAATGLVEEGGGGRLSYAQGIHGGFTIAAGTIIENATGGNLKDTLIGNAAANVITGGSGADIMTGGAGADRFVFAGLNASGATLATADLITDFQHGEDKIDLDQFDACQFTNPIDDFLFVGTKDFTFAGELRYRQSGGETLVEINLDSDRDPEMLIRLAGNHTLTAADFIGVSETPIIYWDVI